MKKELKNYQTEGVNFLTKKAHALLADEMGLGKTVTALAAAEAAGARSVLVICPASVRLNWRQEAEECGVSFPIRFDVISYHGASSPVIRRELAPRYDVLILDEAHFLKTPESQRTQAVFGNGERGLARRATLKWCLTGTPVLNRPRELYPILKTLHAKALGAYASWERFASRYCGAYWDGYAINTKGASHIDELAGILEGFMLRRTKAEVLPELPPRIINRPPLELNTMELREIGAAEMEITDREAYLSSTHEDYAQLGDMARTLHIVGLTKVRALVDFINETLEGEKVVIFARHRDVIEALRVQLGGDKTVVYHGGMGDKEKGAAVSSFVAEAGKQFFVGQIAASGTGINGLQKVCANVVFAELSWVPGEMAQAIDRCHRIGQSASAVNVYLPHVPGTLESAMLQVQAAKSAVIDRLVGGGV